jgi:hypothetical protein
MKNVICTQLIILLKCTTKKFNADHRFLISSLNEMVLVEKKVEAGWRNEKAFTLMRTVRQVGATEGIEGQRNLRTRTNLLNFLSQ